MNDIQEGSNGTGSDQRSELLLLVGSKICGRGGKWGGGGRGITSVCGLERGELSPTVLLSNTALIANEVVDTCWVLGWFIGRGVVVIVGVIGGVASRARRRHRPHIGLCRKSGGV